MAKIIVNADDYGRDAAYNGAIAESFRQGWINQTTLMVNMPGVDEALKLAREFGFTDKIGLHLNLTEGVPLTEPIKASVFCADGRFDGMRRGSKLWGRYAPADEAALRTEIRAQIVRYKELGLPLLHCDSHSHMHMRLPIAHVLFPELKAAGFRTVRRPENWRLGWGPNAILHRVRNALFVWLARRHGLGMTRWFGAAVPDGEFMVHPRYRDDGKIFDKRNFDTGTGPLMAEAAQSWKGLLG